MIKTIPFEVVMDGQVFKGNIYETVTNVGGIPHSEIQVEWEDNIPDVNIDKIVEEYEQAIQDKILK